MGFQVVILKSDSGLGGERNRGGNLEESLGGGKCGKGKPHRFQPLLFFTLPAAHARTSTLALFHALKSRGTCQGRGGCNDLTVDGEKRC